MIDVVKGGIGDEPYDPRGIMGQTVRRKRTKFGPATRSRLAQRDGAKCAYCGKGVSVDRATIDHVVPLKMGGDNDTGNLVLACSRCNGKKGSMDARSYVRLSIDRGEHVSGWLARKIERDDTA